MTVLPQVFFTEEGWPVVSPERYAGSKSRKFSAADLAGEWEVIRVQEPLYERQLEAGQILWGEGELQDEECLVCYIWRKMENWERIKEPGILQM